MQFPNSKNSKKEPLKLNSPEPITDGGRSYNIIYYVAAAIGAILGLRGSGKIGGAIIIAFFGFIIGFAIKECILDLKLRQLRKQPFALEKKVPYDVLIQNLIPVLTPLNMTIEKDRGGQPVITYKTMIYDVAYQDDNTFTIWWRKSPLRAFLSLKSKIAYYRQVVVAMGIIGYHIQQICSDKTNLSSATPLENSLQNSEFKYCTECGTKCPKETKFCTNCGHTFEEAR